ncbi:MAG: glycosyltransferase family 2 protein [Roseiflexaceae bacterium]|nr:glycosyltransferase family 2 protein [Roseiflexaceae bacterium]
MRIGVIIPAYNEAASLPRVLADIPRQHVDEIIVVDNASTDDTAEVARANGARVVREERLGYGYACAAGVAALGPVDVVVQMDADYSDQPAELPLLLQPLIDNRADLVLGSRELGTCEVGALQPHQRFGNWLTAQLMHGLYGVRVTDLGPFRAIRRTALERLALAERTYGWSVEMMVKAARARYRIVEVPVSYRARYAGQSKVSGTLKGSLKAGAVIIGTTLRHRSWQPTTKNE